VCEYPPGTRVAGDADPLVCAFCHGEGEERLLICGIEDGRGYSRWEVHLCMACGGLGVIARDQWEREERGRLMRGDRQARKKSLFEEAKRLGISVQELSRLEWGRGE